MITEQIPSEAKTTLRKAAEWRLLSLLLERPKAGWHPEIEALAKEVEDPLLREAAALSTGASEEAYLTLFGPGGRISLREVAYAGMEDPGRLLADVNAFYNAFAFAPQTEDPEDHMTVETSFIGYMALKEAYAQMSENSEAVEVTCSAQNRFLEAHFARLVRGLAAGLSASDPAYLIRSVDALLKRVDHIPAVPAGKDSGFDPIAAGCPLSGVED